MAKQGQHRHDKRDHRLMPQAGHTNPRKSTPITTGPTKKRKRYIRQAAEHKDTACPAQDKHAYWEPDTTNFMTHEADSRARMLDRKRRSGSDSNADAGTRGH